MPYPSSSVHNKLMKNFLLSKLVVIVLALCLSTALVIGGAVAQENAAVPSFRDTRLPLPRWAALQGETTYVRAGPGAKYPIKWIFKKKGLPLEIIQEFDSWRKVRDESGDEGWVHQTLLTGARGVIVRADDLVPVRDKPDESARLVARAEPRAVMALGECTPVWCRIQAQGLRGWVQRKFLWGIYESENLN